MYTSPDSPVSFLDLRCPSKRCVIQPDPSDSVAGSHSSGADLKVVGTPSLGWWMYEAGMKLLLFLIP